MSVFPQAIALYFILFYFYYKSRRNTYGQHSADDRYKNYIQSDLFKTHNKQNQTKNIYTRKRVLIYINTAAIQSVLKHTTNSNSLDISTYRKYLGKCCLRKCTCSERDYHSGAIKTQPKDFLLSFLPGLCLSACVSTSIYAPTTSPAALTAFATFTGTVPVRRIGFLSAEGSKRTTGVKFYKVLKQAELL